jgi:acyl-CoA synthetase (AMP-forming)/AMP-acid ligase II
VAGSAAEAPAVGAAAEAGSAAAVEAAGKRLQQQQGEVMHNNIGLHLTKRALLNPDREAVVDVDAGTRHTFAEANARANQAADVLATGGVNKGDRVATLLMNGHEFIESFYGLAKIGGVVVAANWRLTADELAFILSDSGAETMLFGTEFTDVCDDLRGRGSEATAISRWIHVGDAADTPAWAENYEVLRSAASIEEPAIEAGDDDLLFIMYTSGTTGLPKGVMHTHSTQLWSILTIAPVAETRIADRYLICLPLFHVGALNPLVSNVWIGGTSIIMRAFDPVRIWEVFGEERVNTTLAVPAMLQFMLSTFDPENHDISHLRWIMSGASPVPAALIERYIELGIEIHQVYGLTESCGPGALIDPENAIRKAGSTGKTFMHTDLKIVGPDGATLGANEPGELLLRGPHIMVGYWNRPDATAETLVDGWLHSGDIAIMDDEGFVYIQDRIKDMIISGGENVYPAEIEGVIVGVPGVREVAVIGVPSDRWGEAPLAVVAKSDDALTADDVLQACQKSLARFKQPVSVEFVDEIPRNPTGKPLKRILRDQYT